MLANTWTKLAVVSLLGIIVIVGGFWIMSQFFGYGYGYQQNMMGYNNGNGMYGMMNNMGTQNGTSMMNNSNSSGMMDKGMGGMM